MHRLSGKANLLGLQRDGKSALSTSRHIIYKYSRHHK